MRKLLVAIIVVGSVCAFADHHEENMEGKNFDEMKAKMSQHLDERIANLSEAKSCVSAATTKEALKDCHQKLKAEREQMKAEWQKKKAEWKASKKK